MTKKLVKKFYAKCGMYEWRRLVQDPYHRLEFDTTMHFLKKHLPKKGLILDAGGGPGRYAIELAKLGYDVILLDLTPELLETAKRRVKREKVQNRVKQITEGSIDNLSMFDNNAFDSVICLGGALSHILNKRQRKEAIGELKRVAKKQAPIFISVIGRLPLPVGWLFLWGKEGHYEFLRGDAEKIMSTGDYSGKREFTAAHFYLPEELKEDCEEHRLKILETAALEGLVTGHIKSTNKLARENPKLWNKWKKMHLKLCTHPTSIGISEHFMVICKK